MSNQRNDGLTPVPTRLERGPRHSLHCWLRTIALAPGQALAFAGLTVAGALLLVIMTGPVALAALGLGYLIDNLRRNGALEKVDGLYLLGVLIGLACCRLVLPTALLAVRWLTRRARRLSSLWFGVAIDESYKPEPAVGPGRLRYRWRLAWLLGDPQTWRDLLWLVVNAVVGPVLLVGPFALAVAGAVSLLSGQSNGFDRDFGLSLIAAAALLLPLTLRGYVGVARLALTAPGNAELERRVAYLAQTRQESLDTGAAELRRIERDLHDGAQARLVAMGLTLDAAGRLIETDPAAAHALLLEARDASAKALAELRDLVRGVHPPVLADRGLADAVRALALDSPVRTLVTGSLPGRPPAPVESAAYFAVSELLANVAKHADAQSAEIDLRHARDALQITVHDNGAGGADPSRGTGLVGVERRLAAFDGVLAISSPVGGPTMITMEVPCELS
jgi:signal transduction histidine kinase